MNVPLWVWLATIAGIAVIFVVSLIFGRKAHEITPIEASKWVTFYVALAIIFGIGIWMFAGGSFAGQFFAGYVTEYALSVDNLFVFVILLTSFQVPRVLQGRVVLIGIMIALVLRGALIAVGAALIASFSWVFYVFGAFLVFTAVRLAREKHDESELPREPKVVSLLRRFLPMTHEYDGTKLRTTHAGRRYFTPMFAVILALGFTDLIFALDSIPAIFGLTQEPFLVFTANAFALLGLSELYFLLGALLQRLVYLSKGLALILAFIGTKLVLEALASNELSFINGGEPVSWAPHITPGQSLAVVGTILAVTVILSLLKSRRDDKADAKAAAALGPVQVESSGDTGAAATADSAEVQQRDQPAPPRLP
jgi:TerC family integral membrane protein